MKNLIYFDSDLFWNGKTLKTKIINYKKLPIPIVHLALHFSDHLHDCLQSLLHLALHLVVLHDDPALPAPELLLNLERDEITLSLSGWAGVPVGESSCYMFSCSVIEKI